MLNPLLTKLQASAPDFIALRRDIHRHPELGLSEHRTSELLLARRFLAS